MSEEWITYETAMERFSADPPTLRRLVQSGRVRTQREDRVQKFEAGDVARAVEGMGAPVLVPQEPLPELEDELVAERLPVLESLPAPLDLQQVAPPIEKVAACDVERALASETSREMGGERWMTYQELLDEHHIKRGWLDRVVMEKRVKWRVEGTQHVYLWADVERCLGSETARILILKGAAK